MKSARAALVPACARLFALTLLVAALPALALDLQVTPRTPEVEPGRDLVLDLVVTPADDEFLDSGSLQVKVCLLYTSPSPRD